jgi:hypothetical protein
MESVLPGYDDVFMDILTAVGATLTGLVTVIVGMFSLAAIWFDDLM